MDEAVLEELEEWRGASRKVRIWWRDDDAIRPTPALLRLADMAKNHCVPVTLAVIPALAEPGLANVLAANPMFNASVHGYAHENHALEGAKKTELITTPQRPLETVRAELMSAREAISSLFGDDAASIIVPPWNRISQDVVDILPELGFRLLSGFTFDPMPGVIAQLNCQLDLMDWRPVRKGKKCHEVISELASVLRQARLNDYAPVGILSHHLVHDEDAWKASEHLMGFISDSSDMIAFGAADYLKT